MIPRRIFFAVAVAVCALLLPSPIAAQQTNNVSVAATVPARPNDYQLSITADPRDSRQSQGADIHYTVTYGSNLTYTTSPFIIQVTLLPGRVNGITVPSLYIADLVQGSASNAYMTTEPVLDLVAHTITWTIPSLPAQTIDQSISFILRTNTSYTGSEVVDFDVMVKAIAPDIILTDTMKESYLYKAPTAQTTPSPTPTPVGVKPRITVLQPNEITNGSVTITVVTDTPTRIVATATPITGGVVQTIRDTGLARYHRFTISKLLPNTSYVIKIIATDDQGQSVVSSTMHVHTTLLYTPMAINLSSLIISSLDTIFQPDTSSSATTDTPVATIPTNTHYTFQLRVPDAARIIRMQGIIRNAQVLGASDSLFDTQVAKEPEASTDMIDMVELSPTLFTGTLKTKPLSGLYELRIRITDTHENITEHVIGTISVVQPFTVLREDSKEAIEHARIFLSRYIPKTGQYIPLSPSFASTRNPVFTDKRGESSFVLPQGTYKAVVSFLGAEKTVTFSIDNYKHMGFPVVLLQPKPLTTAGYTQYYTQNILDILVTNAVAFGANLGSSKRLFESLSVLSLVLLCLMTLIAFSSRTFIPIPAIPRYLLHALHSMTSYPSSHIYISGTVIDGNTRKPIALTEVSIIDIATHTIATIIKTDTSGHYFFRVHPSKSYQIEVRKSGYELVEPVSFQPELSPYRLVHVLHTYKVHNTHDIVHLIGKTIQAVLSASFEVLIVLSFILELLFIRYFGLYSTLPYVMASLVTILLWIAYVHHKRDLSSISQL